MIWSSSSSSSSNHTIMKIFVMNVNGRKIIDQWTVLAETEVKKNEKRFVPDFFSLMEFSQKSSYTHQQQKKKKFQKWWWHTVIINQSISWNFQRKKNCGYWEWLCVCVCPGRFIQVVIIIIIDMSNIKYDVLSPLVYTLWRTLEKKEQKKRNLIEFFFFFIIVVPAKKNMVTILI